MLEAAGSRVTAPFGGLGASSDRSGAAATAAPRAWRFSPVVEWAFYLFVFSLPFEWPKRSIPIEVTSLTGAVFLLATLIQPRACYARRPGALWWWCLVLYMYWVSFATSGARYPDDVLTIFPIRLELVLIFWAAYNLLRDDRIATRAMVIFGLACVALAAVTLVGAVTMSEEWVRKSGRVRPFGQNANHAGLMLASGALALVGLAYGRDRKVFRPPLLVWPLVVVIVLALAKTASRGSMLALVVGLWTFTMSGRSMLLKVRNTIVVIVAVSFLAWAAWQLPLMRKRFAQAEEGDLAARERIFPAAMGLFLERPLLGWGPAQNHYELAKRLPQEFRTWRDTHNLWLEVLTSMGVIGAIPFFTGVGLCVWGSWKARRGVHGILPFAMSAAMLVGNMSGNYIALKLFWVSLAWGAAAGSQIAPMRSRRAQLARLRATPVWQGCDNGA